MHKWCFANILYISCPNLDKIWNSSSPHTCIEGLWVLDKFICWKLLFTYGYKRIYILVFHSYCPVWVNLSVRHLKVMLLNILESYKNWCIYGHNISMYIKWNYIYTYMDILLRILGEFFGPEGMNYTCGENDAYMCL